MFIAVSVQTAMSRCRTLLQTALFHSRCRSGRRLSRLGRPERLGFHGAALIVAGGAGQDEVVAGERSAEGSRMHMVEGCKIGATFHAVPRTARRNPAIDAAPSVTGIDIVKKLDALRGFHEAEVLFVAFKLSCGTT